MEYFFNCKWVDGDVNGAVFEMNGHVFYVKHKHYHGNWVFLSFTIVDGSFYVTLPKEVIKLTSKEFLWYCSSDGFRNYAGRDMLTVFEGKKSYRYNKAHSIEFSIMRTFSNVTQNGDFYEVNFD